MTDAQTWALASGIIAALWLSFRFVHVERDARRRGVARELLHKERMAALEQGVLPPEEPTLVETDRNRLPSWETTMLGLGLLLLCTGIGLFIGLRLVPRTPEMLGMQELASLGLIPALAGAGLVLYWFLLRRSAGGAP